MKSKQIKSGAYQPKIKLVAVSKDKGAYLADWIHHHLYFGFDAIEIWISQTTDNSVDILQYLSNQLPQLTFYQGDWVDSCPLEAKDFTQHILFANALYETRVSQQFEFIMFMDIDEYWTPSNMRDKIHQYLDVDEDVKVVCFEWLNELGNQDPFTIFDSTVLGHLNPLVKSAIRSGADVKKLGLHLPELGNGRTVLADGDEFTADSENREYLTEELRYLRSAMIIRRLFRSPIEYISLLSSSQPMQPRQLSLNRAGFNRAFGKRVTYQLEEDGFKDYLNAYSSFFQDSKLTGMIEQAQCIVRKRYLDTLRLLDTVPLENIGPAFTAFKGITGEAYQAFVNSIINRPEIQKCNDPDQMIEFAMLIEKYDTRICYLIWLMAQNLRPAGPLITQRVNKYKQMYEISADAHKL